MPHRRLLATVSLIVCVAAVGSPAIAQSVHKCVKQGRTIFQDAHCEGEKRSLPPPAAAVGALPWDGVQPGMSPDDVKRITAAVERPSRRGELQKTGVVIEGIAVKASYHFDDNKRLTAIAFERAEARHGLLDLVANEVTLAEFEKLSALLRARYGPERNRSLKTHDTGFPGLSADSDWLVDGWRLFVGITPVTGETSWLSLGLQPAAGRR